MKRLMRPTFVRAAILAFLIFGQLSLLAWSIWTASRTSIYIDALLTLVSLFVVLNIVSAKDDPSNKLTWSILILLAPVFGGLFFLLFGLQRSAGRRKKRRKHIDDKARLFLPQEAALEGVVDRLRDGFGRQAFYLTTTAGFPVYRSQGVKFLASGEANFERLKTELRTARSFVFLEFFIIENGLVWDSILEILVDRVKAGVEVRVMYDDIGCFFTLPSGYAEGLEAIGIRCAVFNPARIVPSKHLNNRDHRKIVVIDGRVAFTGGVNLADEYINKVDRFGHWKDAAIEIGGDAVRSLTIIFLSLWNLQADEDEDYSRYATPAEPRRELVPVAQDGFVQPYADSPMDDESVGESVYMNVLNAARRYVYITTPYLIVDHTIANSLALAAKSGVDVRIVVPRHWDKWLVHQATRSNYDEFISAGIKIYEYVDGFMHGKTFVSDDDIAVVGSTNLDYRSLYLHYECGVVLYGGEAIADIKRSFLRTLERCELVKPSDYRPKTVFGYFLRQALRVAAPLL